MKTAEHQILTRIGFAERWLQRAREECLDGDVARGLVTLVLADAEVRRVLHLAVAPAPRSHSRVLPVLAVGVALILAAGVALRLGVLALGAAPAQSAALLPALTLRSGTGTLLAPLTAVPPQQAVPAAAPVARGQVKSAPVRAVPAKGTSVAWPATPPAAARSQPIGIPAIPAVHPVPSRASVPSPPPAASAPVSVEAPAPAPAPTATLSGVDLLDLVIVADRTLRRSQPSP